jgi:hypothetical protein
MTEPNTPQPQQQQIQVQVRDDKATTVYSNMVNIRPTHTAEEVILDFGVAVMSPERQDAMLLDVQSRVVINYFSAKRLALQLSQIVQRYEQQFGQIELNPHKRQRQG